MQGRVGRTVVYINYFPGVAQLAHGTHHGIVARAMSKLRDTWEVVYVNDGSTDSTLQLLRNLQLTDTQVVVVDLSRNWGHMGAISAGLQTAGGDAVVLMDGDLQDPPDVVPEMVEAWRRGAQVVTAVRRSRQERRKALALLFPLFYRVLGAVADFPIPLNAGIFGLLDRQAVDSINALSEGNRYLPGLRAWVGYRNAIVYYDRDDRVGGEGKLSFRQPHKICDGCDHQLQLQTPALQFRSIGAVPVLILCPADHSPDVHRPGSESRGVRHDLPLFVGSLVLLLPRHNGRVASAGFMTKFGASASIISRCMPRGSRRPGTSPRPVA